MNSQAVLHSAENFEKRVSKLSGEIAITSEASRLPEKQEFLDTGDRTEAKAHNSEWRQFVINCEDTRDYLLKQISSKVQYIW